MAAKGDLSDGALVSPSGTKNGFLHGNGTGDQVPNSVCHREQPRPAIRCPEGCQVMLISGCTNSGKSTIADVMANMMLEQKTGVEIIHQDDFFLEKELVQKHLRLGGNGFFYDYDSPSAIDADGLLKAALQATRRSEFVIVEGNMLTEFQSLLDLSHSVVFLTLDQKTCRRRREQRVYDPPDEPGYFDEVAWPAYQEHLKKALVLARGDKRIAFLDVSSESDEPDKDLMMSLIQSFSDDILRICYEKINIEEVFQMINSNTCGGTSMFIGTTRDTFDGRGVARLDYESYDEMAYKELRRLCGRLRDTYKTIERVVIVHRIGEVPVGEASVIIATASPHRADAIHATEMAIHELKKSVPIWKKEVYSDGGCSWKENGEFAEANLVKEEPMDEKGFSLATSNRDANRKVFWLRQMVRHMGT